MKWFVNMTRRAAGIEGANQLGSIIVADRPRRIELAHSAILAAGRSLVNEQ